MEHYKDSDLSNVAIPTDRLPEVLASLVSAFNMEELEQVIEAVDKEGPQFKLEISKIIFN